MQLHPGRLRNCRWTCPGLRAPGSGSALGWGVGAEGRAAVCRGCRACRDLHACPRGVTLLSPDALCSGQGRAAFAACPPTIPPTPSATGAPLQACRLAIEAQTLSALLALFAASQDAAARGAPGAVSVAWPLVALTLHRALQEVEAQAAACRVEDGQPAPAAPGGSGMATQPVSGVDSPGAAEVGAPGALPPLPPEPGLVGGESERVPCIGPALTPQQDKASLHAAHRDTPGPALPASSIESAEMEDVSDGEAGEVTATSRSAEGSGAAGSEQDWVPTGGAAPAADPQPLRVKKKRRQESSAISGLSLGRRLGKTQVARWQAVQREAKEEERQEEARELAGSAVTEVERSRQAEAWRLQQLRTGAADGNANFAVGV